MVFHLLSKVVIIRGLLPIRCYAVLSLEAEKSHGSYCVWQILVWDMWGKLGSPLFRLQGHRSPVVSVACASGKGRAASLDEDGKIFLWDIRRDSSVEVSKRCL